MSNMSNYSSDDVKAAVAKGLKRRRRVEFLFRGLGLFSLSIGVLAILYLFVEIIGTGSSAFRQTYIELELDLDAQLLGIHDIQNPENFALGNYEKSIRSALNERFPEVKKRRDKRALNRLVSIGSGYQLQQILTTSPALLNTRQRFWLLADDEVDTYFKTHTDSSPYRGRLKDKQIQWIDELIAKGQIKTVFNWNFFKRGDSAEPEQAGILGALYGSMLTLCVTLILSFPVGVASAIYLEEYAPSNKITDFLEVNINNLAAVPSIIFGLLGLAIFLGVFGMPRSIPLVGGLVLTLMTLPTIIISSRAAIRSVPPSIKEAAYSMGASRMQVIVDHVVPIAMPGMLTGTIIGMAQALGETAPLLMIGMVAFIVDLPATISDPATVLPVQIFLWSDSPERAFVERTSAAIMVLLAFLITMNTSAVLLRRRIERRQR